jgi:hypothetical protein
MKRGIKIGLVALAGITSPWWLFALYLGWGALVGRIDKVRYAPTTVFEAARWQKPDRKYRYAVLDFVAKSIVTQGMAKVTVRELLGKPDMTDTNGNWQYEAQRPGFRLIDFSGGGIQVLFDTNDLVQGTRDNTWVD